MEDYSPSQDEVEETPLKKRRWLKGNFLRSWLEHREEDDDDEESSSEVLTADSEQDWRPQRLRDRLRNLFSGWVGVETVQATAQEAPVDNPEQETLTPAEDEGLLAVSPDAQLRYYGYELMDELNQPAAESEPELVVENVETNHPIERQTPVTEVNGSNRPNQGSAEPVGEVLRRRQAKRLEKRVKRLKKDTKSLKREQHEVKQQQQEFSRQLAERQKAQERFETVTVPNMERARKKLQSRLETPPKAVKSEAGARPTAEVGNKSPVVVKTEQQPDRQRNQSPRPEMKIEQPKENYGARLDALLETQELPRDNLASETYFERRHEVKDSDSHDSGLAQAGTNFKQTAYTMPFKPPLPQQNSPSNLPKTDSPPYSQPTDSMYKQAAKNGIWAGVIVTIILFAILLFMR